MQTGRNNLYGLKRNSDVNLVFDIDKWEILKANGCDLNSDRIELSDQLAFSIPMFIAINGVPLFPSKYEMISKGQIVYSSLVPPVFDIKFNSDNPFYFRLKTKQNTITLKDLLIHDVNGRKRSPSQKGIMKESAKVHAEKLINNSILMVKNDTKVDWHWCHLVSFRMLPTQKAQTKRNIICGTAACNGHMANIESAVKRFIYEFKRPLGIQVDAEIYQDSFVASKIAYRVYDKKGSKVTHSEYFDALTNLKTDTFDHETIFARMKNVFGEN